MKSIERRFYNLKKNEPYIGFHAYFLEAVRGQGLSRQAIHRWFNKLVDPEDYASDEKKGILEELEEATNTLRTTENEGELPLGEFIYE